MEQHRRGEGLQGLPRMRKHVWRLVVVGKWGGHIGLYEPMPFLSMICLCLSNMMMQRAGVCQIVTSPPLTDHACFDKRSQYFQPDERQAIV